MRPGRAPVGARRLGPVRTFFAAFFTERHLRRRERGAELSDRLEEVADENAALYSSQRAIAPELR